MNRHIENAIFYLQWFIVSSVAFPVGAIAAASVVPTLGTREVTLGLLLILALFIGLLLGVAQLLVLQYKAPSPWLWLLLTVAGMEAATIITGFWLGPARRHHRLGHRGSPGGVHPALPDAHSQAEGDQRPHPLVALSVGRLLPAAMINRNDRTRKSMMRRQILPWNPS